MLSFDLDTGSTIFTPGSAANLRFGVVASDPGTGFNGQVIVNSTDNTVKVYYNGAWNSIWSITPGVTTDSYYLLEDGTSNILLEDGTKLLLESIA